MNSDRIEGAANDVAGQAQEGFGKLTGDREQQSEGLARQVAGRAQEAYGEARERAQEAYGEAREYAAHARDYAAHAGERVVRVVEQQPVTSLLIAGAIGYVLGLLTARR